MAWSLLALAVFATSPATSEADGKRPNVLFLFSDDQRFDTIRALGNREIQTPNLDRLVHRGFTFTHAYCMGCAQGGAVCIPSRAMLLTGRSLFRAPHDLPKELPLWPEVMQQAGYETFITGKWHNGVESVRGFTSGGPIFFGGMSDQFKVLVQDFRADGMYVRKAGRISEQFSTETFANATIRFLRERPKDKPFFAYVSFTVPHDPRTSPGEYAKMYDAARIALPKNFLPAHPFDNGDMKVRDELLLPSPRPPNLVKQHIADYYGVISHLDAEVSRILKALEETGAANNTLVIFTSDHGLALGRHGLLGKQNLYEHSMRPPLIVAGPGIPEGRHTDAFAYLFDLFPTVCELTGIPAPSTVEGLSLAPLISGRQTRVREVVFGAYQQFQRSVRTERWKLIRYPHVSKTQLFDLKTDPDEITNLAGDPGQAERLKEMWTLLEEQQRHYGDAIKLGSQ